MPSNNRSEQECITVSALTAGAYLDPDEKCDCNADAHNTNDNKK